MSDASKADKLYKFLQNLGLRYRVIKHPNVVTVKDMLEEPTLAAVKDDFIRNIFMLDSSKRCYLISALHDTEVNWKVLRKRLNVNKLHMGDEKDMEHILGVSRGSLSPFSLMNDTENKVRLLFDSRLKERKDIVAHPLHNEESIVMSLEDMTKFLREVNHEPTFMPMNEQDAAALGEPVAKPTEAKSAKQAAKSNDLNILGITVKKEENFAEWFTQVIVRGEMIDYYDISGCYIFLPWSYFIWEIFQNWFNGEIKKMGVDNCYFPMFVSKDKLEAEKNHIEGFSPEVAWVTRYGDSEFQDPIAIRPTSETIMYPEFSRWIRSHRDLPLKLNQWNSVVRWEFKQPTPFIRSREFLWQEGHTAHSTEEEALDMVYGALDLYKRFYEEYLAVPVVKGMKSESEKFPGGKMTTTIETFIPANGRGIQAATSHLLGTNFAKLFDIQFEDQNGNKQLVHQTSWGFTTRSIGTMLMIHGDDKGVVLPPKVAKLQVIIVPIISKNANKDGIMQTVDSVEAKLKTAGIRISVDDRTGYTPGYKFNHWELRGVPLRLEIGTKDVENNTCRLVRRDTGEKIDVSLDGIDDTVSDLLDTVQKTLLLKATETFNASIVKAYTFDEVMPALNSDKLLLLPWCEDSSTEDEIKLETQKLSAQNLGGRTGGMKSLCIPLEQPEMPEGTKCFWTGKPAKRWSFWGRSY
ncbi:prolyl-tRNA synthetase, putative [Theileria equi strain WA]|uniref:proline--tRNA ligase n=1 Tax=Theileria equi strain WA TaxID=1537102 RepID=L0AZN5_THEEQ|nr:prolyl-tRNA synthetase, putative [Theileria equi strain WA]AFZ80456.1 prolyl-tRNA synthetase, putative [Theileria equi strain WA]|eukprot:XP_004830122.1 prolyl-tRNA synthetase, putative [Theileria equi strain WA]